VNEHDQPDREQRVLMPRSAPAAAIPRMPRAHSGWERAARAERVREEREMATLAEQLGALRRDIRAARHAAAPELELLPHHDRHAAAPHGEPVRLPDGASILVRPVEAGDAAQLRMGFEHLGAVSRYRRFLAPIDRLSTGQLSYLTRVDHTSHEAIGALDPVTGEGVGIARYVRDPHDARVAEVAVVVADAWQRRGVGTILFERLTARAREAGVERITARMIVGNEAARRLIARQADTLTEQRETGAILLTARLRG
jgi:GNAT superfamily N-acetyltransferase